MKALLWLVDDGTCCHDSIRWFDSEKDARQYASDCWDFDVDGIPFISQRMVESPSDVVALLNEAECR